MPSGVIHLVPRDRGAGSGVRAVPWQIMTLLVHIHCRGGIFTFGVDKITVACGNNILVVHFEIAGSPHTTVGGDMRLEVTCITGIVARYHNGTHPADGSSVTLTLYQSSLSPWFWFLYQPVLICPDPLPPRMVRELVL